MVEIQTILGYFFGFIGLYVQVLFLVILFRVRKDLKQGTVIPDDVVWPAVTIMVPCWNEEETVVETIDSLLMVDYPKDKLIIQVIDDGSTDQTWERAQKFNNIPNVQLIHKENGGKHTAMNMAIEQATTEFIGNLDADTFLEKDTLKKTMWQFIKDPEMMAVSPTVVINKPKGILERAQETDFHIFILIKTALARIRGLYVTQGQFSVYRKKVFDDLGPYRKAHQTEDLEIAYRMQVHGYKIGECHDALVYTTPMDTFETLFKQRLRWAYGFINNSLDYRKYLFKAKGGTFSWFSVPLGFFYLAMLAFGTLGILWLIGSSAYHLITRLVVTHFHISAPGSFSFFYVDTRPTILISILLVIVLVIMATIGQKIRGKRLIPSGSIIYFLVLFGFVASTWLFKACYNSIRSREVSWR